MTKILLACGVVLMSTVAQADRIWIERPCGTRGTERCIPAQPYFGEIFKDVPGMAPLPKDHAYQWTGRYWRDVRLQGVPGDVWDLNDRVRGVVPDNAPKGYEWAQGEDGDWKLKPEGPTTTMFVTMYLENGTKISVPMPDHWDVNKVKYTTKSNGESIRVYTAEQVAAAAKRSRASDPSREL
jgi:hypothetical protein